MTVDNAKVVKTDVNSSNGVIHVIDSNPSKKLTYSGRLFTTLKRLPAKAGDLFLCLIMIFIF